MNYELWTMNYELRFGRSICKTYDVCILLLKLVCFLRYFDFHAYLDFCEIEVRRDGVLRQMSNCIEFRMLVN